jgi:hypothetical protein
MTTGPGSRTWIKIFCTNWFEGSIRNESPFVRSIWIDLLALAGRTGHTGVISLPGFSGGYTDAQLANIFRVSFSEWISCKERLSNHPDGKDGNRILVKPGNVIEIINWEQYQSEYSRQKYYRHSSNSKLQKHYSNSKLQTDGDGDEDGEKKIKRRREDKIRENKSSARFAGVSALADDPAPINPQSDTPEDQDPMARKSSNPKIRELTDLWNTTCTALPRVGVLSVKRANKIRLRLREHPIEYWGEVFTRMNRTPFLIGEGERGWKASLDWVINNSDNADKVMGGNYDGVQRGTKSGRVRGAAEYQPGEYDFLEGGKDHA